MHKYVMLFSACLIFICGCTVGPDYKAPKIYDDQRIKKELQLKDTYQLNENWYQQFNDTQLNILVAHGLKQNLDLRAAQNKIMQARAALKIAQVQYLPQINATGSYTYEKYGKTIGPSVDTDYFSAGFDASWELDLWGKGRRQIEADEAELKALSYSADNIKTIMVAEIVADYVSLRQTEAKLRLAKKNSALQKDILQTIKNKYNSGLTDNASYQQAAYLLSTTEAQIPQYQILIEQYRNALSLLLGILPSELPLNTAVKSPLFTAKYTFQPNRLYNLPASVIRLRPDVAAAEQKLIAQNALLGKAIAELYPDVNISAMWGYAAHNTNNLISSRSKTYSYAPLISLPLLDWNQIKNNIELQKYVKTEAFINYQQTVLNAVNEIKNAMVACQNEQQSLSKNNQAVLQMQTVVQSMLSKYKNGLIEFSDVLSSQQNLINAENAAVDSRGNLLKNIASYYKASGTISYNSNR